MENEKVHLKLIDVNPILLSDTAEQYLANKTPVNATTSSMYVIRLFLQFNIVTATYIV